MARINKLEALQEMQEGLRLDTMREKTPDQLADKILPVFEIHPRPRIIQIEDTIINDASKTVIVPLGKKWNVKSIFVQYVSTATVGNRQIVIIPRDSAGKNIGRIMAGAVQAASLTRFYTFFNGAPLPTAFITGVIVAPLPELILTENFQIEISDNSEVDVAADDMEIRLMVEESDTPHNR